MAIIKYQRMAQAMGWATHEGLFSLQACEEALRQAPSVIEVVLQGLPITKQHHEGTSFSVGDAAIRSVYLRTSDPAHHRDTLGSARVTCSA